MQGSIAVCSALFPTEYDQCRSFGWDTHCHWNEGRLERVRDHVLVSEIIKSAAKMATHLTSVKVITGDCGLCSRAVSLTIQ